ncbi:MULTISPECIES: cysteine desulfurase family protein [Clostridium]|uniref:cysteine desulfurase family protein n=1 Tax=Clostridium TaxID=1485 RepID=UPI000D2DFFDF|nr:MULTISPECIES: cysteine desulfurase family protein [Clostridium]MBP8859640.1 cysteine desulfurase [Lawsonibacter sp.]MBS5506546.1 cysteine desulfurase [Oscillospiraceae bacterium]MCB5927369.1 cysteine desulfurase [bacterium 210820-DFI.5.26]GBF68285.1 cysteine desulfurase [Lawsonibacter asaccharolyticus]MCQ5158807.1 cysteine desulfurase [Clostridium sp. DFI.5.61]
MFHYLDNAATTQTRPEAAQAAVTAMTEEWGNPSSRYAFGQEASGRLKEHRAQVAAGLGCRPEEVYFLSCGTEGDNWAIAAAVEKNRRKGKHIITTAIEHAAVLEPIRELERQGYEVTWLQPDQQGIITAEQVEAALRPDTILVAMMLVNNELGTVLPVAETARAIRAARCPALLHCDAVQGFLKVPFTPEGLGVDTLAVSGHKVHAPKGIGALYIRRGLRLPPLIRGGGQEEGLRSGTEPTAQTAAFAAAVEAGRASLERDLAHMRELKDYAARTLREQVPGLELIGAGTAPHILPVTLPGYKSEVVLRFLSDRGIYVSSGSACHKGKPSHVYAALKLPKPQLDGILRISFSYDTAREDVDALVQGLKEAQAQLFTSLS